MSSGRWHTAQFLKRIGATSLVKVICLLAGLLLFALMVGSVNRRKAAKAIRGIARYLDLILTLQELSTKPHEGSRRICRYLRDPSCGFVDSLYFSPEPPLLCAVAFFAPFKSTTYSSQPIIMSSYVGSPQRMSTFGFGLNLFFAELS